jgi:hypothetical protein
MASQLSRRRRRVLKAANPIKGLSTLPGWEDPDRGEPKGEEEKDRAGWKGRRRKKEGDNLRSVGKALS